MFVRGVAKIYLMFMWFWWAKDWHGELEGEELALIKELAPGIRIYIGRY